MLSDIVRGVLRLRGKKHVDLQPLLGIKTYQTMSTKFLRGSWSVRDLIKVAELCDMDLMFVSKDRQIMLPITDEPKEKAGDA